MQRICKTLAEFDASLESMRGEYPRIDFALEAMKLQMLNKPEQFLQVIGREVRVAKFVPFEGIPDATIYFHFDKERVVLLSMRLN